MDEKQVGNFEVSRAGSYVQSVASLRRLALQVQPFVLQDQLDYLNETCLNGDLQG